MPTMTIDCKRFGTGAYVLTVTSDFRPARLAAVFCYQDALWPEWRSNLMAWTCLTWHTEEALKNQLVKLMVSSVGPRRPSEVLEAFMEGIGRIPGIEIVLTGEFAKDKPPIISQGE